MAGQTGVYPCYENQFQAGGSATALSSIANINTFEVAFDNGVEEWNSFESKGWMDRLMTSKSITLTCSGKRTIGDKGNDYIASKTFANGRDAEGNFQWTFPDGLKVLFKNAIISVTNCGTGESTSAAALEFAVMSNGKPEVIEPGVA